MAVKTHIELAPGLKVAAQMFPESSDEEMASMRQIGIEYAVTWIDGTQASPEYYRSRREHFARGGLQLYGLGNGSVHNMDAVTLNLPNRDEKVEEYKAHLRNLGQADIPYTTYAHMANTGWTPPPEQIRGASRGRTSNMVRLAEELTHGREYTEDELWDNFASFAREIAPVAEEAGVRIGIHPDDPPGVTLGGIPRPIFSSFDGYKRALEIADSPNVGMCLCIGCWLAGGKAMGRDVVETIHYFGGQGKIFKVHYRNIDKRLPGFGGTFVDEGYFDLHQAMHTLDEGGDDTSIPDHTLPMDDVPMDDDVLYSAMCALVDVGFDGALIPDHDPPTGDDGRLGTAYILTYMRALQKRVEKEVG